MPAILALRTGDASSPMNLHVAADVQGLRKIIATAQAQLSELERKNQSEPLKKTH
jgi:hypothetical protein